MRQVQQQDKKLFLFVMPILGSVLAFPFQGFTIYRHNFLKKNQVL